MRIVKLEKPFQVDMLIREARKRKKPIKVCLKAGRMLQSIVSYTPKEFLTHLQKFRTALEVPRMQYEELMLVLDVGDRRVEFRTSPVR